MPLIRGWISVHDPASHVGGVRCWLSPCSEGLLLSEDNCYILVVVCFASLAELLPVCLVTELSPTTADASINSTATPYSTFETPSSTGSSSSATPTSLPSTTGPTASPPGNQHVPRVWNTVNTS